MQGRYVAQARVRRAVGPHQPGVRATHLRAHVCAVSDGGLDSGALKGLTADAAALSA